MMNHENDKPNQATGKIPAPYDERLRGFVDPEMYGQGQIIGDILAPFPDEWEADASHLNDAIPAPDATPAPYDERLRGFVDPELYGTIKVVGDIMSPIDVEWECDK